MDSQKKTLLELNIYQVLALWQAQVCCFTRNAYLITLPTHSTRQILVTLTFTDEETEDGEVSRGFTDKEFQGIRAGIKSQGASGCRACVVHPYSALPLMGYI